MMPFQIAHSDPLDTRHVATDVRQIEEDQGGSSDAITHDVARTDDVAASSIGRDGEPGTSAAVTPCFCNTLRISASYMGTRTSNENSSARRRRFIGSHVSF